MADTLNNIILPRGVWVNLYDVLSARYGSQLNIKSESNDPVLLHSGYHQPTALTEGYVTMEEWSEYDNDAADYGAWALSQASDATINPKFISYFSSLPIFQTTYDCSNGIDPIIGGTATYTCASTAQYSAVCADDLEGDPVGTIKTAAIDQPRIESGGVVCNGAVENVFLNTNNLEIGVYWKNDGFASVDKNFAKSPDGSQSAALLARGAGSAAYIYQIINTTAGVRTDTWFVKKTSDTLPNWVALTSEGLSTWFNIYTGLFGSIGHAAASVEIVVDGYFKISVTYTSDLSVVSVLRLADADNSNIAVLWGVGDGVLVWDPNSVALPFPVAPIYTDTAPVTMAATNLTYPVPAGFNPALFSCEVSFGLDGINTTTQTIIAISNASLTEYVKLSVNNTGNIVAELTSTLTDTLTSTAIVLPNVGYKALVIFDGVNFKLIVNGTVEGSFVATAGALTAMDKVYAGSLNGTLHMFGHLSSLKISDYDVLAGA